MTLHEAIQKVLHQAQRPLTNSEIAKLLNKHQWYKKSDDSPITPYQIHGRTKNYPQIFQWTGALVSLVDKALGAPAKKKAINSSRTKSPLSTGRDEHYVLNFCDIILGIVGSRQHRFDFLLGDPGVMGKSVRLPVDIYYAELSLVIEYCELQHSEAVRIFDKPSKMTVSGVHRGQQRKIYDERRRTVLREHGIRVVEISYSDFNHDSRKKIIRHQLNDQKVIRQLLGA